MDIPITSRVDLAYQSLRSQITTLEIPPGRALPEAQLASRLGLSKTPVREALTRLRYEGFVVVDANSRFHAAPVTIKDTQDLFAMRILLESEAAALAASRPIEDGDLKALEDLQATMYDVNDPDSIDAFLEANTRFHVLVGCASGNQRLAKVLEVTMNQMERLFRVGLMLSSRTEEIVHEHVELVRAIKEGDADRARAEAMRQVRSSRGMVLDALLAHEEIYAMPLTIPGRPPAVRAIRAIVG